MAVTGIWKIDKRLDRVIIYTTNAEKVKVVDNDNSLYRELHNIKDYNDSDFISETQEYVSAINCSPSLAYKEMMITKEEYGKTGGILGFHAFQSFAEGEVTPSLAHTIGIRLAQEMWGDRFEVVVSTHVNTNHIHNHFVINSVSFKDGKKYYDKRETYAELRKISDALCEEYGLSVIKEKSCKRSRINYDNYFKEKVNHDNYYTITKSDLDLAISQAYSYKDFEDLLRAMGYSFYYRANKLSVRKYPYKKNIRVERCFGEKYSIESIKERIKIEYSPRIPFIEEYSNKKYKVNKNEITKQKKKGIYALYLYYCYLLKVYPTKNRGKKLPPSMRVEVKELDRISDEVELLVKYNLETDKQFFSFKEKSEKEYEELKDQRSKLWYRHKKEKSVDKQEKIKEEIENINKRINVLRKEVRLCDGIEERIPKIKDDLQDLYENLERKDVVKDERK